jgi:hypothetical protein
MATFQENLSEQTAPAIGSVPAVATPPTKGAAVVAGINAIGNLAEKGIEAFKDIKDKEVTTTASNAALDLIEQHDQGLIDNITYRRKKKELSIQLRRDNPGNEAQVISAMSNTFGIDPIPRQENAEAKLQEALIARGVKILGIEASDADTSAAGAKSFKAEQIAIVNKAELDLIAKNKTSSSFLQTHAVQTYTSSVIQNGLPILQSFADLAADVKKGDEVDFFLNIKERLKRFGVEMRTVQISGTSSIIDKDALAAGDAQMTRFFKAFDIAMSDDNGFEGVKSFLAVTKKIQSQTDLDLEQLIPLGMGLQRLMGNQTMALIATDVISADFRAAVKDQVSAFLQAGQTPAGKTFGQQESKQVADIMHLIEQFKKPFSSSEGRTPAQVTSLLTAQTGLLSGFTIDKNTPDKDIDSFHRLMTGALHTIENNVKTPINQLNAIEMFASSPMVAKLKASKGIDREVADSVGIKFSMFAGKVLREAMNRNDNIKFDKVSQLYVFAPDTEPPPLKQAGISDIAKGIAKLAVDPSRLTMSSEEIHDLKMMNAALVALDSYKEYNPSFSKLGPVVGRESIVYGIEAALERGSKTTDGYRTDFLKRSEDARASQAIVAPTPDQRALNRAKSRYDVSSDKFEEAIAIATVNLRKLEKISTGGKLPPSFVKKNGKFIQQTKRPQIPSPGLEVR